MAYRAEIQIGVVGIGQLGALQKSLNQVSTTVDILNKKQVNAGFNIQNINTYNAQLEKAWKNINKAAMGSQEELKAVQDLVRAKNNQIAAQDRLNRMIEKEELLQRKIVATANAGFGPQGPALPPKPAGGAKPGRQMASPIGGTPGMAGSPAAKAALTKQLENIALGVGFPLLFGGGVGQTIGGGLGSFVGTGFGGQIIGSAIGGLLETFATGVANVGTALQKPIENFQQFKDANLFASAAQEKHIEQLIESGQALKASELIYEEITKVIGFEGVRRLDAAATSSKRLNAEFADIFLTMQAGAAGPLAQFNNWLADFFNRVNKVSQLQIRFEELRGRVQGPARETLEREVGVLEFQRMFRGLGEEQFIEKMTALLDRIEKSAKPKPKPPQTLDATKKELEVQAQLADTYASRYKVQLEKGLLVSQLNGQLSQDYVKLNTIQKDYLATNEKLAVKLAELRRIEEAGGVAKGVATQQQLNQLRQEIEELSNEKISLKVEANKESLRLFEEEIKRSAEAATRNLELQAGAIQGRATLQQSEFDLMRNINDLQLQRLSFEEQLLNKAFEQTGSYSEQLAILDRLEQIVYERFKLNVANAKVERAAAIAQLKTGIDLLQIEFKKQQIQLQRLRAVVQEARAMGVLNQAHIDAVDAQASAVSLAGQTLDFAVRNAVVQERIANAVYNQKVEAAGFARNMELSALAARRADMAVGSEGVVYGQGLGQVFRMGTVHHGPAMAKGGYVTRPTMALIGEGGEPEFVVPQSKASAFAENWMAGRRGAEAIPRMSGSASNAPPSINITTGPVMQQEGTKYVTLADMESAMQSMASAMLGSNRSYSGRRYQGVR